MTLAGAAAIKAPARKIGIWAEKPAGTEIDKISVPAGFFFHL